MTLTRILETGIRKIFGIRIDLLEIIDAIYKLSIRFLQFLVHNLKTTTSYENIFKENIFLIYSVSQFFT